MGEIKSTLDLVMERTRHLSLSDEEKAQQQRADFEKRLQGLLQQYADGAMDAAALDHRILDLHNDLKIEDRQLVVEAIFGRINPDQDNQHWMDLLSIYVPAATAPLQSILAGYDQKKKALLQDSRQQQEKMLRHQHHIEGKAVIPNPRKATYYLQNLIVLQQEAQKEIEEIAR